jgi:hypothetical protein
MVDVRDDGNVSQALVSLCFHHGFRTFRLHYSIFSRAKVKNVIINYTIARTFYLSI